MPRQDARYLFPPAAAGASIRYFEERHRPNPGALRRKIEGGAESVTALPVEAFATAA